MSFEFWLRLVLIAGIYAVAIRYLQETLLARGGTPLPVRRKWGLALLATALVAALYLGVGLLLTALALLSPFALLLLALPLRWLLTSLPLLWIFKVPFGRALRAAAWATLTAVMGEMVARLTIALVFGATMANPLLVGGTVLVLGLATGGALLWRRHQAALLRALADEPVSEEELQRFAPVAAPALMAPAAAEESAALHADLDLPPGIADFDGARPSPPLAWRWAAIFVGGMTVLLFLVRFVPGLQDLFPRLIPFAAPPGAELPPDGLATLSGGLAGLGALLLLYLAAGAALGATAPRPVTRELGLGGLAVAAVQLLLLALPSGGGWLLGRLLMLVDGAGEVQLQAPAALFLLVTSILCLGAALGAAHLGHRARQAIHGEGTCQRCRTAHTLRPPPSSCPACGAPIELQRIDWRWVGLGALALTAAVILIAWLAGPLLGSYWRCPLESPGAACGEAALLDGLNRIGTANGVILVSTWRYLAWPALLFLLPPLLCRWRARQPRRTARLMIWTSWLAASVGALIALGFLGSGSGLLTWLRIHLLAGAVWLLAGAAGLWIGSKLRVSGRSGMTPEAVEDRTEFAAR